MLYHTKQKVSGELQRLQKLDIIDPAPGKTTWLNSVLPVLKHNGKMRLCLDMQKAIERGRHVIPKLEEILPELHNAKIFSKLDLREGYNQILLDEESRPVTAFATHDGVYQYKRLVYGINSAFKSFQNQTELVITGIKNAKNISDDIIIWDASQKEHGNTLEKVFSRIKTNCLKINKEKFIFSADQLTFSGHTLTSHGIAPDKKKIEVISNIQTPTNTSQAKSFTVKNYCHQFIANFSTITEPLRRFTKKNQKFICGKEQEEAFQTLKQKLTSAEIMCFYDPIAETNIIVDAGPKGLGAILSHKQKNRQFKPILYSSVALKDVESRYSQTEKEALAVTWAFQHYHYYIYDRYVTVCTYHEPLERLLRTSPTPPPRFKDGSCVSKLTNIQSDIDQESKMRQTYYHDPPAQQAPKENPGEQHIHHVINEVVPVSIKLSDIITDSAKDEKRKEAIKSLETNWCNKSSPFYKIRDEFTTSKNIQLKSNCIVIPQPFKLKILEIAHNQYQGISKTKARLREKVWWPGLSADAKNYIKSCYACRLTTPSTVRCEALKMSEIPKTSWHTLTLDIKHPFPCRTKLLVLIDYHSRYPVVTSMKTENSVNMIKSSEKNFSLFGCPARITTDNGPQFNKHIYQHTT